LATPHRVNMYGEMAGGPYRRIRLRSTLSLGMRAASLTA